MQRRQFLAAAAATSAAAAIPAARAQSGPPARIEVLAAEPIGTIAPEIYGHFVEHLGGVVYDGIWVGENAKVAHEGGIRKALVDALKQIKPGQIRWPGGCFADSYNWRDGVGPYNTRPRRANFWLDAREWPAGAPDGPWKHDTNRFGSQEFLRFCELTGAKPYLAANLRSLTSRDFYEWVDYLNSPTGATTLAELRATHGRRQPFNVRYFGIGNESWGCGGNFNPEEYAVEYRRFAEWVPKWGLDLAFIGSGPNGGEIAWTRRFFEKLAERRSLGKMWGWALHHYSWNVSAGRTNDWFDGKGAALNYPLVEWYELLNEAAKVETLINEHWAVMGETDRAHRVKLVVDEWGSWFKPGSEVHPTHLLGQQSTMRDAVLAGLSLDIFHRHADKVAMANIAQLVNCLQALFLAQGERFVLTPTYHVFAMYAAHQGAQSLRTLISAPRASYDRGGGRTATMQTLGGSASRQGNRMVLTVTNADPRNAHEAEIAIRGAVAGEVRVTVLEAAGDLNAHNRFEDPRRLEPKPAPAPTTRAGGVLTHRFPAASVTRLEVSLA
ncbi:MAG: alpha-L-arabinofuranosidase [Bryobacterales bacterium]|nr:alpha-L-arabinofuranosidase [Bryobacterales bacterium]